MKLGLTLRLDSLPILTSIRSVTLKLTPRLQPSGLGIRKCRRRVPRSHQVIRAEQKTGFGTPKKKMTNFANKLNLLRCLSILEGP